ncbi:MAG: hypothetical protein NT027_04100 [Proteobacteria bacterium]|nr:hypothetical protein [Pseudomonadota bacterium]
MKNFFTCFLRFYALMLIATSTSILAQANEPTSPYLAPRELIVLKSGLDRIYGTYVLAVIHRGTNPQELSFPIQLPKETIDFQPMEGLEPQDFVITGNSLAVKKTFNPGVQVLSITFMLPADSGSGGLTLTPPRDVPEFIVMTPRGLMELSSNMLVSQGFDQQDNQIYQVFSLNAPLKQNQPLSMTLSGIPQGRKNLWIIGSVFIVALSIASGYFAYRTRSSETREPAYV